MADSALPVKWRKLFNSDSRGLVGFFVYIGQVLSRFPKAFTSGMDLSLSTVATILLYGLTVFLYWRRGDRARLSSELQAWFQIWKPLLVTSAAIVAIVFIKAAYALQRETNEERNIAVRGWEAEKAKNTDPKLTGEIEEVSTHGRVEPPKLYELLGLYFTVKVNFVNQSPAKTSIKKFFLQVSVGDGRFFSGDAVEAETLDEQPSVELVTVYDDNQGKVVKRYVNKGRTFQNLFKLPMVAEHAISHRGWLQFYFAGIDLRHLYNGKMYLIMVDHKNNLHASEPFAILPDDKSA